MTSVSAGHIYVWQHVRMSDVSLGTHPRDRLVAGGRALRNPDSIPFDR